MIAEEIQTQSYDENTFFVCDRNTLRYYYDRMVPRKATVINRCSNLKSYLCINYSFQKSREKS